jgi:diacylglycerol kinase (ATP)
VVAGGDGTVAKVIGALGARRPPLAILPFGGANNVARAMGIEGDPLAMARAGWREAVPRRLDVGTAAGPWGRRLFLEAVGVGAVAEATAAVDDKEVPGPEKSELARTTLRRVLAEAEPKALRIIIDGEPMACRCLLAEIMNIPATGPKLRLAPAADPSDGLLDLVWLEPAAREPMLAWLEERARSAPPLASRRGRVMAFEWQDGALHVSDAFPPPPARPELIEVTLSALPVTVLVPTGGVSRDD